MGPSSNHGVVGSIPAIEQDINPELLPGVLI